MTTPTRADILAAADLLGVPEREVPIIVGYGQRGLRRSRLPRTIAETAGDLPCDDCHAPAGKPCDVTIEH